MGIIATRLKFLYTNNKIKLEGIVKALNDKVITEEEYKQIIE